MLFVALLVASLSLIGMASASAAEPNATQIQTSNTNTLDKEVKTQSKSANISIDSTKMQKPVDKSVKKAKKAKKHDTAQSMNIQYNVPKTDVVSNVASSTIQQESCSNISNDVKTNADEISVKLYTTVTSTQQKATPSETTTTIPVTENTTDNIQDTSSKTTITNSTTSKSTVNNTANTTQYAAAGTVTSTATTATNTQIIQAANYVKNYYATNHKLPSTVTINGRTVNMYTFLYMLSTAVQNLYNHNNNLVPIKSYNGPQSLKEQIYSGYMSKSGYISIADQFKVYMDKTGYVPGYASSTSLGPYFGWQSLVLMYSNILNSYSVNKVLPSNIGVKPTYMFTKAQVMDAAVNVKNYYNTYKQLPSVVSVNGMNINMYSFLYALTKAIVYINNNNNSLITVLSYKGPQAQMETIKSGNMGKTEYLKIASDVKSYMDQTRIVPGYASSTSLGTYFGWQSMILMYSNILAYYASNNALASTASVKPISGSSVPAELQQYLAATANCQVNDSQIKSLAASITAGKTSTYDKAVAIFNWVRDNLSYSFYYNTKYGAVGALNNRTGNCVDTAHLVVALERAAGIPARYEHLYAQFSSGSWYGHVIAQVWVNGIWYNADGSSNYNSFGVINNWNTATATYYGTYTSLPF